MGVTIRDPVHGAVQLADWALLLIDHPVVQRLRRIHQLGTAHLVYPGAHHRRFEHCIGASHLAGKFADALQLDPADRATARAAALLHDVGHGPFSHAFEELTKEEGRRHEETSVDLIRWGPLADLLRQGGQDPVLIADTVAGRGRLAPLVSGALDADRMDYLLRDAHYTGVPTSVDAERLTEVLQRDERHGIVLQEGGLTAAESLLTTRFLMYPTVYLHHTVRSTEAVLLEGVRHYVADGHASLRDLERETDDGLLARLRQAGGVPAEMVARLDERRLYKRALEMRAEAAGAALVALAGQGARRRKLAQEIAEDAGVPPHHVLLDVPHPPKFREMNLHVIARDGTTRRLPEASKLVAVLQEARMDHWRAWVFAPKQDRERVAHSAARLLERLA